MSNQEVRVVLGLDTTKADASLAAFFAKLRGEKPGDPFKGLGTSFEAVEKQAKALGLTWEATTQKFKNGLGKSFAPEKVVADIRSIEAAAKASGQTFSQAAAGFKGYEGAAKQASQTTKQLGDSTKTAAAAVKGLQVGALAGSLQRVAASGSTAATGLAALGRSTTGVNVAASRSITTFNTLGGAVSAAGQKAAALTPLPTKIDAAAKSTFTLISRFRELQPAIDQTIQKSSRLTEGLRAGLQSVISGIPQGIGLAVGNLILAPLAALGTIIPGAVNEFKDLDAQIRLTLSIAGEAPAKFGVLEAEILKVGAASAATTAEVGEVAKALARAGFSLEEISQSLSPIVQGAEATGTAYATMADVTVAALGQFKLQAADTADVIDTLVKASTTANQTVSDIGEALKYVGPIANAAGQNLQDVAIALGLLANAGIKGSTAGTSLRTLLTNLTIASAGASEEFTELSRGSARLAATMRAISGDVTDANGALLRGTDLIYALQDAFAGLTSGETAIVSKALAGAEGLPTLNTLVSATGEEVEALATAMDDRLGTAAQAQADAMAGLSGAFRQLDGAVSTTLASVGSFIASGLTPLLLGVSGVLNALNGLPGPIKSILLLLGTTGAVVGVLSLALRLMKADAEAAFGAAILGRLQAFVGTLKAANIQATILGWRQGFVALAATLTTQVAAGLAGASTQIVRLTKAVTSGAALQALTGILGKVALGLRGIAPAAVATQLSLFGVAPAATATQLSLAGVGVTSAAATGPVAALGVALGSLLVAILPIALVVGALVVAWKVYSDIAGQNKKVTDAMAGSQKTLNDTMAPAPGLFTSWGSAVEQALGPLDKWLSMTTLGYVAIKFLLEGLGRLYDFFKDQAGAQAAIDAQEAFNAALSKSNRTIADNLDRMKALEKGTAEYGKLANENVRLERGQVKATEERIKAQADLLDELKKAPAQNAAQIAALEAERNKLVILLPQMRAREKALQATASAARQAAKGNQDYGRSLTDLQNDRAEALEALDLAVYAAELKALNDLRDGVTEEATARARGAQVAVDAANQRIAADEAAIAEARKFLSAGKITQSEYDRVVQEFTGKYKETLKERATAEVALNAAVAQAIDARLAKYGEEQQIIADNFGKIRQTLSELGQLDSGGIAAFKALADGIAGYELALINRNKDEKLKAIEEQARAGVITEKQAAAQRKTIEADFAREKKALATQQFAFDVAALRATTKAKEAELALWVQEKQIAADLAIIQNAAAQARAQASGDTALLAGLREEARILGVQKTFIAEAAALKRDVIGVETDAAKFALISKAAQEGINVAITTQVGTIAEVQASMDSYGAKIDATRARMETLAGGLTPLSNRVTAIAEQTKTEISGALQAIDTEGLARRLEVAAVPPNLRDRLVSEYTGALEAGATSGATAAATILRGAFGDAVPKSVLEAAVAESLVGGSVEGKRRAAEVLRGLPATIPVPEVAAKLGEALGGGAFVGQQALDRLFLSDATSAAIGVKVGAGITAGAQTGSAAAGEVVQAEFGDKVGATIQGLINFANTGLRGLALSPALETSFGLIRTSVEGIVGSGLSAELKKASDSSGSLTDKLAPLKNNISPAVTAALALASALERALRAAAGIRPARWAGGDVTGGQRYQVNELGRELFMDKRGAMSEIRAPAFGSWRAPSDGTVIPASIAQQIRERSRQGEVGGAVAAMASTGRASSSAGAAHQAAGGLQRQLLRELRNVSSGGHTVNHVNITTDKPIEAGAEFAYRQAKARARMARH